MAEKASLSNANNGENLTAEEQLCLRLDEEARYAPYVRSIIVIRETCNFMKIITLSNLRDLILSLYILFLFLFQMINLSIYPIARRRKGSVWLSHGRQRFSDQ